MKTNPFIVCGKICGRDLSANKNHVASLLNSFQPKYFVDSVNGVDTNNGLSEAAAWKTLTKVNATSFAAGDSIGFKAGQTFSGQLIIPTSGQSGNPIIFGTFGQGAKAIITQSTLGNTFDNTGKNYVTIQDLDFRNENAATGYRVLYIKGTTLTGFTMQRCTATGSKTGVLITVPMTDCTFDKINITSTENAFYAYGNSSTNITITNVNANGGGFYVRYVENITFKNNIAINVAGTYVGMNISDCTGTLDFDSCHVENFNSYGIRFTNSTFIDGLVQFCTAKSGNNFGINVAGSSGITLRYCIAYDTLNGLRADNAANNITWYGCLAMENKEDGIQTSNAHDITFIYCRSTYNGDKTTTAGGDGFTTHLDDYNINILYCIADYNTASGMALVGNSTGLVYGCTVSNNAGDWSTEGGLDQIRGGISSAAGLNPITSTRWKVRNCIFSKNYPREVQVGASIDMNNNCYDAIDSDLFASIDGGADMSWTTYHATKESDSIYQNPQLTNLIPATAIVIGEDLGEDYDDGLDISTNWGNENSIPTIATKLQPATGLWQVGAYVI